MQEEKQEFFERKKKRHRTVYKREAPYRETPLTRRRSRKSRK
jgi:hypothetical protein